MRNRIQQAVALVLLSVITTLVFLPSLEYDFLNWDDTYYIHQNSWLRGFSLSNIVSMFGHHYHFNYHPLTILSYTLEFQLFGLNPAGYHATNLVLHVGTVLLLFGLLRLFSADVWTSFLLAQLFAIHPLRVESVVWISERKDVLCSLFYLLALCLWVSAGKAHRSRERELIGTSILAFLLAAISKAMAVSFPFVIFLYDLLCQRRRIRPRIPAYLLLLVAALFFSHLNMQGQQEPTTTTITELKTAIHAPLYYAAKTLFPLGLSPMYPMEFRPTLRILPLIAGCAFVTLLAGLALAVVRRHPRLTFGIIAAGIILAPVSGILTVGYSFAADRYTYLPTAILFAGIAPVLSQYAKKTSHARRTILRFCFLLLAIAYASVTLKTAPIWSDSITLWKRVLAIYPESVDAKRHLANAWGVKAQAAMVRGETEAVERLVDRALRIDPADLGALRLKVDRLLAAGEQDLAENVLQRALMTHRLDHMSKTYALGLMGVIVRSRGENAPADSLFREAFSSWGHEPTSAESRFLASLAAEVGDTSLAMHYYQRALEDEPLNDMALRNLARLYAETGDDYHAFFLFRRLTEICPDDSLAQRNMRVAAQRALRNKDE